MKEELQKKLIELIDGSVGLGKKGLEAFIEKFPDVFAGYIHFIVAYKGALISLGLVVIAAALLGTFCKKERWGINDECNYNEEKTMFRYSAVIGLFVVGFMILGHNTKDFFHAMLSPVTYVLFEFTK